MRRVVSFVCMNGTHYCNSLSYRLAFNLCRSWYLGVSPCAGEDTGLNEIEVLTEKHDIFESEVMRSNAVKYNPFGPKVCLTDVYARQSRQFKAE